MAHQTIEVRKSTPSIGAEILGLDLSQPLDDRQFQEVHSALMDNLVLFFRDQPLPPARFLAVARRFGEIVEYPFVKGLDDYPEIIPVVKLEHERINFGGVWHSDTAYLDAPPMASMLLAREVPPAGGDTLFANMYLAYEGLSEGMKRLLADLRAVNSSSKADASRTREDRIAERGRTDARTVYEAAHPVIRVHPEGIPDVPPERLAQSQAPSTVVALKPVPSPVVGKVRKLWGEFF